MIVDQLFRCAPSGMLSAHIRGIVQYGPSGDSRLRLRFVLRALHVGKAVDPNVLSSAAKCGHYVV